MGLAVGEWDKATALILLGNGKGTLAPSSAAFAYSPGDTLSAIEATDFNADGNLDLALINSLGYRVRPPVAHSFLPQYNPDEFNKADFDLNAAYRDALSRTNSPQLRKIERAWLAYRDAWVDYAALRWPSSSADSWRTWLTLEEVDFLKNGGEHLSR
jgi:hypothetical protein